MFLRSIRLLALLGALCCFVSQASAQMMQMTMPRYPMLMSKPVQQELKLSEDQIKKIQAKIKELTPEGGMMGNRFEFGKKEGDTAKNAGGGEAAPPTVSFGVVIKGEGGAASPPIVLGGNGGNIKFSTPEGFPGLPDFKKIDAEVDKLLEQPQRNRLKQIALQRQGLSAIAQDDVAKEVGLEPEQRDIVKHIMEDQQKKTQEFIQQMLGEGSFQQDKMQTFIKKQREQTEQDLAIVMSPDQKAKWEEMNGPKFEFKKN